MRDSMGRFAVEEIQVRFTSKTADRSSGCTEWARSAKRERYAAGREGRPVGGWEIGRDGKRRSSAVTSIAKNGAPEITAGEMQRRHEAWQDEQPLTVACGLCAWAGFTGPAGVAREAARAHLGSAHPERVKVRAARRSERIVKAPA